ncbi:hypothetical protein [Microbulbifer sp. JMSA002]|uniref:hypothetical protein n=1 Tax=Microbulbifer sp. JMSA002 TaxID=3243368 RepID=UPI00403A54D2
MRRIKIILFFMLMLSSAVFADHKGSKGMVDELSVITMKDYKVIEIAVSELRKKINNFEEYKISLYKAGRDNYVVIFSDPNMPAGQRGSSPKMPSFKVEINAKQEVINSHFIR